VYTHLILAILSLIAVRLLNSHFYSFSALFIPIQSPFQYSLVDPHFHHIKVLPPFLKMSNDIIFLGKNILEKFTPVTITWFLGTGE
jgi:hypothetical protein